MTVLPFSRDSRPGVAELAEQRLKASPYFFLRYVSCEFAGGALVLRGRAPIPALLSVAESLVANIEGVVEIINCLEVGEPFSGPRAARNAG